MADEPRAENNRRATAGYVPGAVMSVEKPNRYVPGSDWQSYTEQLEFFFLANGVEDATKKKAILLANEPAETFQLIKDLLAPTKPSVARERMIALSMWSRTT